MRSYLISSLTNDVASFTFATLIREMEMQSNTAKRHLEEVAPTPRARPINDNARRIMARSRYQAPSVASYAISGCEQSGPVSMMGNTGDPELT